MNSNRIEELLSNFDKQILVIGDIILDRFVYGNVNRFSPESPSCVILDEEKSFNFLGGAANTAANFIGLGAKCVRLCGLLGFDPAGQDVRLILHQEYNEQDYGIDDRTHKTRRITTVKTRFVSQDGKHLLRHDREDVSPAVGLEKEIMLAKFKDVVKHVSAVVIEDYGKGVVTADMVRDVMDISLGLGIPVFIDPKNEHWEHFQGAEVVTPNINEAYTALGRKVPSTDGELNSSVDDVGDTLLKYTRAKSVIITRGSDGMSFYGEKGDKFWSLPKPVNAVDVSGAGDTAVAMLTLSKLAGASWKEATTLANLAAGIAVQKAGTAIVKKEDILKSFPNIQEIIND